jgi:hypothetical protein
MPLSATARRPAGARSSSATRRARSSRRVAHRLDVVAVVVEHERRVVISVIVRPKPRATVVFRAGGQRGFVEGIDGRAVVARDRDMQRLFEPALATDPEVGFAVCAEARGRRVLGFPSAATSITSA